MTRDAFQTRLLEVANEALQQLPESIDDVKDVRAALKSTCALHGFLSLKADLGAVFQLDRLSDRGTFSRGFPGIVLTATAGRILNPSYMPTQNFYDMNPRAVFEKHIAPVLRQEKFQAPMGKSDPLNVAKNQNVLNEDWTKGKRPETAAMAALRLIRRVEQLDEEGLHRLLHIVVTVYVALGKLSIREYRDIEGGLDLYRVHHALVELIEEAPAGGDTPQAIIGSCLQAQHDLFGVSGTLYGVGESVFATNTTSGKPGDFAEEFDSHLQIYEVSVKRVDEQRVSESAAAVRDYLSTLESPPPQVGVTFLCRPQDVEIENLNGRFLIQDGITYHFAHINEWLLYLLERLGPSGRARAIEYVNKYAGQNSTSLLVKNVWSRILGSLTKDAAIDEEIIINQD